MPTKIEMFWHPRWERLVLLELHGDHVVSRTTAASQDQVNNAEYQAQLRDFLETPGNIERFAEFDPHVHDPEWVCSYCGHVSNLIYPLGVKELQCTVCFQMSPVDGGDTE